MRTFGRPALAAALALVLSLGVTGMAHADEVPEETPVAPLTLDNAQLRWSLTAQLHQKPFYGQNFLTAGVLADTKGGDMPASRWKQSEGAVSIVRAEGSTYVPATWKTFGTGADHQVVINGGSGTIDPTTGAATITWTGSFGVARYSGQTGFTVTNPRLVVENGKGRLEGIMNGFGVSRDGNGSGAASGPLPTETVVLADLGTVDLSKKGFSLAPTFYGVNAEHPEQKPNADNKLGSFPPSFIKFVDQVGQSPYWMTSGSPDDALKVASPVTVSFNAKDAVVVPPPKTTNKTPKPIVNKTKKAPKPKPRVQQTAPPAPTGFVPPSVPPVVDAPVQTVAFTPTAASSLTGLPPVVAATSREPALAWWLAATFLLLAAVAAALPGFIARSRAS